MVLRRLFVWDSRDACQHIEEHYQRHGHCLVVFLYFAQVMKWRLLESQHTDMQRDYLAAVEAADVLLPDGIALQLFASWGRFVDRMPHNLNGTDFIPQLLAYLHDRGSVSVYIFSVYDDRIGKDQSWTHRAAHVLEEQYPGLMVRYIYQEEYMLRWQEVFDWDRLSAVYADDDATYKVFIHATGTPFQEQWVATHAWKLQQMWYIHLAAGWFLDFVSGFEERAPQRIVRARVLETFWRIVRHPKKNLHKFLSMFGVVRYVWWRLWHHIWAILWVTTYESKKR